MGMIPETPPGRKSFSGEKRPGWSDFGELSRAGPTDVRTTRPAVRTRHAVPLLLLLALAVFPSAASGASGRDGWWSPRWAYRLWFNCPAARTGSAGKDIGVVEFHAAGRLREDASDLRVLARSVPVGHRVIQHRDTDDFYRVAFELAGGERRYAVYLGNPAAKPTADGRCEVRRGCLLETFTFSGGSPGDLAGMKDVLRRAEPHPLGAA
ncbi:unnamed protein product, partial [marine sediment metagenome]